MSSYPPFDALDQLARLHAESRRTDPLARLLVCLPHAQPACALFVAVPSAFLALFLPDTVGFTLFLAPAGLMTIAASLGRIFPHAALDMSLILILQWGLFRGAFLRNREPHTALCQG